MHEYSIVAALLKRVETEAKTRNALAVRHIRVRLGELAGLEPELLASAFELCRESGLCASADLEIVPVRTCWSCPACGTEIAPDAVLQCPDCALPARLQGGAEMVLETIDMEVA